MRNYDLDSLEIFAKQFAGNWREFEGFVWRDAPEYRPLNWGIYYTQSEGHESTLARVNAEVIAERLAPWTGDSMEIPDVVDQYDRHWAMGHVEGYAIRVYDADGNITEAAKELYAIECALDRYPILDEARTSEAEVEDQWNGWECYGRSDFRDELSCQWYSLGDAAGRLVALDFSEVSNDALDAFVEKYRLSDCWEHDGAREILNIGSMAAEVTRLPLDAIINAFFADLESYQERHTGQLFAVA